MSSSDKVASFAMAVFFIAGFFIASRLVDSQPSRSADNPADNSIRQSTTRTLNINRTYSDIDGREIANPRIRFADGTEIVGSVIVRQLRDNTWQVKIKPDDAKKSEMTVIVDVVTESATYFDLGPSPDNPGAIRS